MDSIEYRLKEKTVKAIGDLDQLILASETPLQNLRCIRDMVIGNKLKKSLFIQAGLVQRLMVIITDFPDMSVKAMAITILDSEIVASVLEKCCALDILLPFLNSRDPILLLCTTRALKYITRFNFSSKSHIFLSENIENCLGLVKEEPHAKSGVSEAILYILANCCNHSTQKTILFEHGLLDIAVNFVLSPFAKCQEASMYLIAVLIKENEAIAKALVSLPTCRFENILELLHLFIRCGQPYKQLLALNCIVNLYNSKVESEKRLEITQTVLPFIIKLIEEEFVQEEAPLLIVHLMENDEGLHRIAAEYGVLKKLASIVHECCTSLNNIRFELLQNCLLAVATLVSKREENRRQVAELKMLENIRSCFNHPYTGVRLAAIICIKNMARSVRNLRSILVDNGSTQPLINLLSDEDLDVKINACGAICNLVMGFSTLKYAILSHRGIEKLVYLSHSMEPRLRVNAVWALKNLLYQSDSELKKLLIDALTFNTLKQLIDDSDIKVQENTAALIRNLACGQIEDLNVLIDGFGSDHLLNMFKSKLGSENNEIKNQILFTIANIAAGNEMHKSFIFSDSKLLEKVLSFLEPIDTSEPINNVIPAIWCMINLTWQEEKGANERIKLLRELGVLSKLSLLLEDSNIDVRDRAKTAVDHFSQGIVAAEASEPINRELCYSHPDMSGSFSELIE